MENYLTPTVEKISRMAFDGNVIPKSWFDHLKTDAGKPDTIAIMLLSEIVYWYRPSAITARDRDQVIGYKKRFKADKLQKSYDQLAEEFGYSKEQVKDALKRLQKKNVITLEFRTITTPEGAKVSNVLFIEPNPDELANITYSTKTPPIDKFPYSYGEISLDPSQETSPHPMEKFPQTNTETTNTKTTKETREHVNPPKGDVDPLSQDSKNSKPEEVEKVDKGKKKSSWKAKPANRANVETVFNAWVQIMNKSSQVILDTKRGNAIEARLEDGYSPEQIIQAIHGCRSIPHNMGFNDRNTQYNDIELICRNIPNLDRFMTAGQKLQAVSQKATPITKKSTADQFDQWAAEKQAALARGETMGRPKPEQNK